MPGFNGAGPRGQGPQTGRGMGPCGGGMGCGRRFGGWFNQTPQTPQLTVDDLKNQKQFLQNELKAIDTEIANNKNK
jgi:hypothetical protein